MIILYSEYIEKEIVPWAEAIFEINSLTELHLLEDPILFSNYVERLYYRVNQLKCNVEKIRQTLDKIKNEVLVPIVSEIAKFQFPPSIRCHLVGGGTASAFHKDGEPKYGISSNTLNLWLPLTKVWGTNSIYIEKEINSNDFREVALNVGEMIIFDAFNLTHGSFPNTTPSSRVSLDIRFVPRNINLSKELGLYANASM